MANIENLPPEILSTILAYANNSSSIRQVSHTFNETDQILDIQKITYLNNNFPDWKIHPEVVFVSPNVDINILWFVLYKTGKNYKLLAENTPNPDVLIHLINSGYSNLNVIVFNAARLNIVEIVNSYLRYIQTFWTKVRDSITPDLRYLIEIFDRRIYAQIGNYAAKGGNLGLVQMVLDRGADNTIGIIAEAALNNHANILRMLDERHIITGIGHDIVAANAALKGYRNLVTTSLNRGATNYEEIAVNAARGCHTGIVEMAMSRGNLNFNRIAAAAALGGCINILNSLLKHVKNFDEIAVNAAKSGHEEIVRLMLLYGVNNYEQIAVAASSGGFIDIILLVINDVFGFKKIIEEAGNRGHVHIIKLFINHITDFNHLSIIGARAGSMEIVKIAIEHNATSFGDIAINAALSGKMDILRLAISLGVNSRFNYNNIALAAAEGNNFPGVKFAIDHGASNFQVLAISAWRNYNLSILELVSGYLNNDWQSIFRFIDDNPKFQLTGS
jgi:hypothetical protein